MVNFLFATRGVNGFMGQWPWGQDAIEYKANNRRHNQRITHTHRHAYTQQIYVKKINNKFSR